MTATAKGNHGVESSRTFNFNVLMDDPSVDPSPAASDLPANSGCEEPREESLEELMAAHPVNTNISSDSSDSQWNTATSHKTAKPRKVVYPANSNRNFTKPVPNPPPSHSVKRDREPITLIPQTTLEFHSFPPNLRTADLKSCLSAFTGKYRLKWNNDTSCWFVFDGQDERDEAMECVRKHVGANSQVFGEMQVRLYADAQQE